jgi:HD-GYP domain-containing protein (c-di-GMP phosphodiesterase class II)
MKVGPESRLAEVLAAMSVSTDLAMGLPAGHAIRACLAAIRLARRLNLGDRELATVYYTALLRYVGCTAFSHEEARLAGDDVAARRMGAGVDFTRPRESFTFMIRLTAGSPPRARLRAVAAGIAGGRSFDTALKTANCEVAARTAERLGLGSDVAAPLYQIFERWDGHGVPAGLAGERVALASRLANVVHCALLAQEVGGAELGDAVVRHRSGSWLDPEVTGAYLRHRSELWASADDDPWRDTLAEEPSPVRLLARGDLRVVAAAFADLADLKSPFLHGHARAVASHAEAAGRELGLGDAELRALENAALLHDIGRVAIPTSIWEKPAALTELEWEQVRQHPYHTERILGRAPVFSEVAKIAALHHERLDGSGYHRQLPAALQPMTARLLAVADALAALLAERPHRPAFSIEAAASELESAVARGQIDPDAAGALLAGYGRQLRRSARRWPGGLTDREVQVLRLLAAGRSKRDIARELFISISTAHTHVVHIYDKIGATTRAGAALFAMEHGLYLLEADEKSTV